ncbi:hypothetical protein Tco_0462952 [Tanacetum coccineum]
MTSPNKPTSKPSRVAKMSVKPIWRKKLNLCNTSNELNVSSPTPMPKPLTPHHEPSEKNNHPNQSLPNPYINDTPTSPQVVSHPLFPISPINSHVTHTQAPPQSDNQTQHTPPLSPSRESLVDDINQLQDLSNLLAMHLSQQQNNIPSSPYSPNLPHTLNINQVETHVGYCPYNTTEQILEPLSKMTKGNKKQYIANVKVMNYLLQAIPNDIYNLVDALKEGEYLESGCQSTLSFSTVCNLSGAKYVTMVHYNQTGDTVSYDELYDSLVQFEPHVLASRAKKASKNHDPLALLANLNASLSQYHANSSYLPQPYYVTHPSSIADYEDKYKGELQRDSQVDKLTTAMMLLARAITQKFSIPTNNRICTSSNTRNQAVIHDGRVDIQTKNAGYGGNSTGMQGDKTGIKHLMQELGMMKDEENDFMLDNSYGDETLEELTVAGVSEVNASNKVHEQVNRVKCKTIIHTSDDDQIDSNIIFNDPYVENNDGTSEHDSNAHYEYHDIQMLAYNVQREAENKKQLNNELNKQKELLQKELKTFKAQPKMYHGEMLHSSSLKIDSLDFEETLEDAKESRLKMRNKMVQLNYGKLNALYETFVPQQEHSAEQTYFSIPSNYNICFETKEVTSDLPSLKMQKECKLLKMFEKIGLAINDLQKQIDVTLLEDRKRRWMSDNQNSLREFYKTDVILMYESLSTNWNELQQELIEEVQEMLNIFESMEQKVAE